MRQEILRYLGYSADAAADENTDQLIDKALREVEELAEFKYVYASYDYPQEFMLAHPAYMEYLYGSEGYLLCATTIGIAVDRRLKRLQMEDMAYAVVFDATAGIWIERKADEFEKALPYPSLGFRFCPGYQGTPLEDNLRIANLVKANKIGISFLDSGLMIPMKCAGCVARESCAYRRQGVTCYSDETMKDDETMRR